MFLNKSFPLRGEDSSFVANFGRESSKISLNKTPQPHLAKEDSLFLSVNQIANSDLKELRQMAKGHSYMAQTRNGTPVIEGGFGQLETPAKSNSFNRGSKNARFANSSAISRQKISFIEEQDQHSTSRKSTIVDEIEKPSAVRNRHDSVILSYNVYLVI